MARYLVRANCEYPIEVKAATADEAMEIAQAIDVDEWHQCAWSGTEAEEVKNDPR